MIPYLRIDDEAGCLKEQIQKMKRKKPDEDSIKSPKETPIIAIEVSWSFLQPGENGLRYLYILLGTNTHIIFDWFEHYGGGTRVYFSILVKL